MRRIARRASVVSPFGQTCGLSIKVTVFERWTGSWNFHIELAEKESVDYKLDSQTGNASGQRNESCNCTACSNSASDPLNQCNHADDKEIAEEMTSSPEVQQEQEQQRLSCFASCHRGLVIPRPREETNAANPNATLAAETAFQGIDVNYSEPADNRTKPAETGIEAAETGIEAAETGIEAAETGIEAAEKEFKPAIDDLSLPLAEDGGVNEQTSEVQQQEKQQRQENTLAHDKAEFEVNCFGDESFVGAKIKASPCCGRKKGTSSSPENPNENRAALIDPADLADPWEKKLRQIYDAELIQDAQLHRILTKPLDGGLDMSVVRRNLRLVKAHRHPTQIQLEFRRLEDSGVDKIVEQVSRIAIRKYYEHLRNPKKDPERILVKPVYPEWLSFKVRIKKPMADAKWAAYVQLKRQMRRKEPKRPAVKLTHKYNPEFIDSWTRSVMVAVKAQALVADIVNSAFPRLGLDHRADFRFTIGCFVGDSRHGNRTALGNPLEVFEATSIKKLYQLMADEIFVNNDQVAMFREFPDLFDAETKRVTRP